MFPQSWTEQCEGSLESDREDKLTITSIVFHSRWKYLPFSSV